MVYPLRPPLPPWREAVGRPDGGKVIEVANNGRVKMDFLERIFSGSFAVFIPEEGGQMAQDFQLLGFAPGRK